MAFDPAQALPLLHALSAGVNIRAIYPPGHPKVEQAVDQLVEATDSCLRERGQEEITFLIIDRELLVDDRPIRALQMTLAPLVRTLSGHGIERLTLAFGLDREESQQLIGSVASGEHLRSSEHVVLGQVELGEGDRDATGPLPRLELSELSEEDVDRAEDSFLSFREQRSGSIEQLDQMLWRFVEGMDQASRSLLLMGPMKSVDQRLFVHSINVSLLTLAQARTLGIEGQALHDIGLAAMLHDIGKMSLPDAVFEKTEPLTEREWEVVKQHPELGAAQLASMPGVSPLAALVAYEHHLRWDGKASFPVPQTPRIPNVASQLTAIADSYDMIVASRGLGQGIYTDKALEFWQERSGTFLDPFLVGNFVMMISSAATQPAQPA